MGSDWPLIPLGQIAADQDGAIAIGPFGSRMKSEVYVPVGVPVIRGTNISKDRSMKGSWVYVTKEFASKLPNCLVRSGDLVFPHRGAIGEVALIEEEHGEMVMSTSMMKFRPDTNRADSRFLYYFFRSSKGRAEILKFSSQVGTPGIGQPLSSLRQFVVPLPPLSEQKNIAHILGSLDDKIELNRRMNETLEGITQALFKSWFVDFDPVIDNALAASNPIPEELQFRAAQRESLGDARKPLPIEVRTLFPSEFEHTEEMGWIPKGWRVGPISELADLNPESWTAKNAPPLVRYVDLANTKNGRINLIVPYRYSEAPSRARRVLRQSDTIIGTVRPGNRSFAFMHYDGLTGSTGFAVMRPKEKYFRVYVYSCLTRDEVIDHLAHLADGAAYPAIRPGIVAGFTCVLPSEDLLQKFEGLAKPWMRGVGEREAQIHSLSALRDTLLPKLLSGELRIPEVEKIVEGAV